MTAGFEQKAPINPGRHTPGQRLSGPSVVVGGVALRVGVGVGVGGRHVVPAPDGDISSISVFGLGFNSLRLMQHLPPLVHTASASMKSHR